MMNEVPYELYLAFEEEAEHPVYYDAAPVTAENECLAFVAGGGDAPERGAGSVTCNVYARALDGDGLSEVWADARRALKVFDESCEIGGVHITRTRASMPKFDGMDQQGRIYEMIEISVEYVM